MKDFMAIAVMKRFIALSSISMFAILGLCAGVAGAAKPTTTSGHVTGDDFAFSCGSFDVRDNFEFSWHGTEHYDRHGNLVQIQEQISGVDRLYNPLNGKSVSGTFYNHETVDLANGYATQNGSIFRIIIPGSGAVFIDVGKYVFDFDEGFTFLAGRHDFFDEDFAEICAYLA